MAGSPPPRRRLPASQAGRPWRDPPIPGFQHPTSKRGEAPKFLRQHPPTSPRPSLGLHFPGGLGGGGKKKHKTVEGQTAPPQTPTNPSDLGRRGTVLSSRTPKSPLLLLQGLQSVGRWVPSRTRASLESRHQLLSLELLLRLLLPSFHFRASSGRDPRNTDSPPTKK